MKQFVYAITDPVGIHARPAGLLVQQARRHKSRILLHKGEHIADATRMMSVMGLGLRCGDSVTVTVEGPDEAQAVQAMQSFFAEHL